MMERKILQIMPVSVPVWAKYRDETSEGGFAFSPVLCLPLVEWEDDGETFRGVFPMDTSESGEIDFCDDCSNYVGLSYSC